MLPYDVGILERGIRGIFAREFLTRQKRVKYTRFTSIVNSDKEEEKYAMIGTLPQLAELIDERALAGFSSYDYTLKNKTYVSGVKVPRRVFDFDQTGQLRTLVQSLGARVANFPDKLVAALLQNGDQSTYIGYDTAIFFSSSHDLGNGTSQINKVTGNVTDDMLDAIVGSSTDKADRDNAIAGFQMDLMKARAQLAGFTDDRGEPWHDSFDAAGLIIVCSPKMEAIARVAIEGTMISDTTNMTLKLAGDIITSQYPLDATASIESSWYLLKVDTPIQPFIFQRFGPKTDFPDVIPEADQEVLKALNAVEIQTVMRGGQNIDAHTFFNDEFLFGARVVYSAGYGMWQNAIKVQGTANA